MTFATIMIGDGYLTFASTAAAYKTRSLLVHRQVSKSSKKLPKNGKRKRKHKKMLKNKIRN